MIKINTLIINTQELKLTGCIKAKVNKEGKYKLRIFKDNSNFLTYNINQLEQDYPLQLGTGIYQIGLYKNINANKYALQDKIKINNITNNFYLSSNIYVNYKNLNQLINFAKTLKASTEKETIFNIKNYIKNNYLYDYIKSLKINPKTFELPNISECFQNHLGICQDLAALTVALFRINNIPARLAIGYRKNQYHAWVEFHQKKKWNIFDPVAFLQNNKINKKKYTIERWY